MSNEYEGQKDNEGKDGPDITYSDFVGRIVQDPSEPPDVQLLSGFLGASSEEGHVRLYLDEELRNYVEVPRDAIRHTQEIPPEQSPLGGSLVWIDRKAEVLHGKAGAERTRATFLEGQITKEFGGGAAAFGGAAAQPQTLAPDCVSQLQPCIPPTEGGPACMSQIDICIPRTEVGPLCHTLTGILCTRIGVLCRQSAFNPDCTRFGPKCQSAFVPQCVSAQIPCITHDLACQASSFAVCHTGPDPTINQQGQAGQQAFAAAPAAFGSYTQYNCGYTHYCWTQFCPGQTSYPYCPPRLTLYYRCPEVARAAPGGGEAAAIAPTFSPVACRSAVVLCPTAVGPRCPSVFVQACQTGTGIHCPTHAPLLCPIPTRFNCPSINIPCQTQFGTCETFGACPSAVDACPTFFGCESQAGCFQSQACGGGFPGGGFGGGGGQQFMAQAAAQPGGGGAVVQTHYCPSQVYVCPPTLQCQSQAVACTVVIQLCPTFYRCPPSRFVVCPTQIGCQSQACGFGGFPGGGGFGGAGGQQFAAGHQGPATILNCPSIDVACNSMLPGACPSIPSCHGGICQAP